MVPKILSPDTEISGAKNKTVVDFWAWAYSDILSNRNRSIFAEFIIATALNITQEPRIEWDNVDLRYQDITIEVKSSAYLQSWKQNKLSDIRFDIKKKNAWDATTEHYPHVPVRAADCYIFCLFTETDLLRANVLNLSQWRFYIVKTDDIENYCGNQQSISLKTLEKYISPSPFDEIKKTLDLLFAIGDN